MNCKTHKKVQASHIVIAGEEKIPACDECTQEVSSMRIEKIR